MFSASSINTDNEILFEKMNNLQLRQSELGIVQQIGNTPLIRIRRLTPKNRKVEIYAKAEWLNPGGSVKDRPAWFMIQHAIATGELRPGKIILDATSGNTGIGYAMIGAALGYKVKLCLPQNASPERIRLLRAYGADLCLTDPLEGTDGAIEVARKLVEEEPERYYYIDQYNNPWNWKAHYYTTGNEIWQQTNGKVTHFVAGLGTTGTFCGVVRRLKEYNPVVRAIAVQPDSPFHGIEGLKHLETAIVPGIYDETLVDEHISVSTEEARQMMRQLAKVEGLFVGTSSGAALAAALKIADKIDEGVIVTIFPDRGDRYLSELVDEE